MARACSLLCGGCSPHPGMPVVLGLVVVPACCAVLCRAPDPAGSGRRAGFLPGQPLKHLAGRLVETLERRGLTVDGKPNLVEFTRAGLHFEMSRASDNCMLLQHASERVASPIPIHAAATDDAVRWECPVLDLSGMSDDDMPDAVVDKVLETARPGIRRSPGRPGPGAPLRRGVRRGPAQVRRITGRSAGSTGPYRPAADLNWRSVVYAQGGITRPR